MIPIPISIWFLIKSLIDAHWVLTSFALRTEISWNTQLHNYYKNKSNAQIHAEFMNWNRLIVVQVQLEPINGIDRQSQQEMVLDFHP